MKDNVFIRRGVNILVAHAHENAEEHGFYEDMLDSETCLVHSGMKKLAGAARDTFTVAELGRIASEVGEAIHAVDKRTSKAAPNEALEDELADIYIRTASLCGFLGIDLGAAILRKMEINEARPYKHMLE